jgi:hypothetical protein
MCVHPPCAARRFRDSGGTSGSVNDCTGAYSFDFNVYIQSGADPALAAWTNVYAQYWSRDPSTASTTGLTTPCSFQIWP